MMKKIWGWLWRSMAIHLTHLLDDELAAFTASTEWLDTQALRANPSIKPFAAALGHDS